MNFTVNNEGFPIEAVFDNQDVWNILVPLLRHWASLVANSTTRKIVFLAAPPGAGKTTLALALAQIAHNPQLIGLPHGTFKNLCIEVQGIDGFHLPNAYLTTHTFVENGQERTLFSRKGAPFTYDIEKLIRLLMQARSLKTTDPWPRYSRIKHDVIEGNRGITGNLLLLEGNYLLLPSGPWSKLTQLCDESIMLLANEEILRNRLINRKIQGGLSQTEAELWYEQSDGPNVRTVLAAHQTATLELRLTCNGRLEVSKSKYKR